VAAEDGLEELDAGFRAVGCELAQALEQEPGRKDDLDREPDLGLPALRQLACGVLQAGSLLDQSLAAPVEKLAGRRKHRLAAADLEDLHRQQFFELLDGVGKRGLTFVQALRRLPVTA